MEELLLLALKRIEALEKKLERYYSLLKVENEVDFILKGTYITTEEVDNVISGI